ncbi:MAG: 5-(carboxyamino)imidazole ribonucleotide synthase [Candidatus Viridilinea halotolerans]|uniref:N5-carboxyaminoimidazole ribonucleotide synthase n=1 Tax=Candidatus Viridilinea halotolerans TaxID=2491704 RepID=A0A426UCI9_9CHLR|nr:MAG: 5-(carboxyamino)imidazole ribonucleotide synthase [Candidatus Viridilinea halotolerans]
MMPPMLRIGIFGGGQLAQMLTQAALGLGLETVIFERTPDSPAGRLVKHEIVGPWDDPVALAHFADYSHLVTLENEFVDAHVLAQLEAVGKPVFPTAATVGLVQDKFTQKQRIAAAGLAVPPFRAVATPAEVLAAAAEFGWPLMLKARRNGYDGYGNATVRSPQELDAAWQRLAARGSPLMVEAWVEFRRELALMVVRGRDATLAAYPVVETVQREHVCHTVLAPAPLLSPPAAEAATALACSAIEAIAGVGVFGVELFELADGRILFNELAPRPHNSGHYTIEGCVTSQFENHLRAILGWPLGATDLRAPAVVMVNLLGQRHGPVPPDALHAALAIPGVHIHLYGKREVRPGRKMGHVTALGQTLAEAKDVAQRAAALVEV